MSKSGYCDISSVYTSHVCRTRDSPAFMHVKPTTVSDEHPLHQHNSNSWQFSPLNKLISENYIHVLYNHNTVDQKSSKNVTLCQSFACAENNRLYHVFYTITVAGTPTFNIQNSHYNESKWCKNSSIAEVFCTFYNIEMQIMQNYNSFFD